MLLTISTTHSPASDLGYLSLLPEYDEMDRVIHLDQWCKRCCAHDDMNYASERVGNMAGCMMFREAIDRVETGRFPVLCGVWPNVNSGQVTPSDAATGLLELREFSKLESLGTNAVLVDDTGYVIFEHVAGYDGLFILDGTHGIDIGIGEFEFFIQSRETQDVVFQAVRISQRLLNPKHVSKRYDGQVEFTDLDTGTVFVCSTPVSGRQIPWPDGRIQNDAGQVNQDYPKRFFVELRETTPKDFSYIVEPLTRIFQASIATGNPVRWC